jgi:hypothetical protein
MLLPPLASENPQHGTTPMPPSLEGRTMVDQPFGLLDVLGLLSDLLQLPLDLDNGLGNHLVIGL